MTNNIKLLFVFLILSAFSLKAEVSVPRLSPLPEQISQNKVDLNGKWLFNPAPQRQFWQNNDLKGYAPIEVPGEWIMQGFEVKKGAQAAYRREFSIPQRWSGERIKLRCNGIFSESVIYINGEKAGGHTGGFTAFELDVTEHVRAGKNDIAIGVVSESLADSLASASRYAVHSLGGITRDIYLFALPKVNIASFHANTSFDKAYRDATLNIELSLSNENTTAQQDLTVEYFLKDHSGKVVALDKNKANVNIKDLSAKQTKQVKTELQVANPHKWDSESPYLYTLTCVLKQKNKVLYQTSRKIGFRQIEVRGNELFVNNYPVKLRGVCRHEIMPLRGRSVNGDMWRKDVQIFRDGNVNYIRTSHYPPDEALLDACDELGMFVEMEAPFCWAHETKVPEEKHTALLVTQTVEMVNRDRSHPSVLIWSLGNESNLYNEYFKKAGEVIKEIDPTRPRIFSQWGPDADNNELEIGNHHYPGPGGPDQYRRSKRPIVFDEFCHMNAYNRLELSADPGLRDKWGVLLDRMWSDMYYSKGVLGGAIWGGIDDTFFLPGDKPVGYGTWGVIDGWRRAKPEYWGMKKAYSPVRITLKGNISDEGVVAFDVENRHNFLNLSACKIKWTAGKASGFVNLDVAPRVKGSFKIDIPARVRGEKLITIDVENPQGFNIDQYRFSIRPERVEMKKQIQGTLSLTEDDKAVTITTAHGQYKINQLSGLFQGYNKKNELILSKSPMLMVLPLNDEGRGIQMLGGGQNFDPFTPVCENWIACSIEVSDLGNAVKVTLAGEYKEADGSFVYEFSADGKLSVSYDFVIKKDVSPRQTGLVFAVPESFRQLEWKRKGYWSVYPDNHIALTEGTAQLFDSSFGISGLAGPGWEPRNDWSTDQTASGSNDFRSTKESIYHAALSQDKNKGVHVLSNGTQCFRSWKSDGEILFLVGDYDNAGSDRFLVSHASKDYRPLRKGDRISGTVVLEMFD